MTGTPLFHIGVLVEDIDAAMRRFSELLGLTFGDPWLLALDESTVDDTPLDQPIKLVYSMEGPPYLELIEAQDSGLWGRQHGEGLHHIGVYQDQLEARILELPELGAQPQAILRRLGETLAVYLSPESSHGTRIEFVRTRPAQSPRTESTEQTAES